MVAGSMAASSASQSPKRRAVFSLDGISAIKARVYFDVGIVPNNQVRDS